jgi:hypothetical protein
MSGAKQIIRNSDSKVRFSEASIVSTEKNGDHVLQVREDYIFRLQIPQ